MVNFEIGNLFKMPQILKIPELGMAFITMMVARMAYGKNIQDNFIPIQFLDADGINSTIALWMVVYGFLLIAVVQLLGTFGGSNPLQDTLMAFCGFGLYLGVGAKTAAYTHQNEFELGVLDVKAAYAGLAAMCILTSLVYLVDFVFSLINLKKS